MNKIKVSKFSYWGNSQNNTSSAQCKPFQYHRRNYLNSPYLMMMTSGNGQYHTNEVSPDKPDKKLKPYLSIGWAGIKALVDNPQEVDKSKAQWLIPSPLPSRSYAKQETQGQFDSLWGDVDNNPTTLSELAEKVENIIGDSNYEIYTSRSATLENQKARVMIPLARPLTGSEYILAQQILNDRLEAIGITPDRSTEGAAQLCYLPNRGEFYDSKSKRELEFFDPLIEWSNKIAQKNPRFRVSTIGA